MHAIQLRRYSSQLQIRWSLRQAVICMHGIQGCKSSISPAGTLLGSPVGSCVLGQSCTSGYHLFKGEHRVHSLVSSQLGQLDADVGIALLLQVAVQLPRHLVQAHVLHQLHHDMFCVEVVNWARQDCCMAAKSLCRALLDQIVIYAVRCSPCTAPQSCMTQVSWHGSHSLLPSAWPTLLPQNLRVAEDVLQVTFKSLTERSGIPSSRMLIVRSLDVIFRLDAQPVSEPCPSDPTYSRRHYCKPDSLFNGLMTSFFWGAVVPLTPGRTIFDELLLPDYMSTASMIYYILAALLRCMCWRHERVQCIYWAGRGPFKLGALQPVHCMQGCRKRGPSRFCNAR